MGVDEPPESFREESLVQLINASEPIKLVLLKI
jgi:hypothetical protein